MSTDESNKEFHANNNDTLSSCLKIIDEANTKKNTHMPSSHGAVFQSVSNLKCDVEMKKLAADVGSAAYFDELLNEGEH